MLVNLFAIDTIFWNFLFKKSYQDIGLYFKQKENRNKCKSELTWSLPFRVSRCRIIRSVRIHWQWHISFLFLCKRKKKKPKNWWRLATDIIPWWQILPVPFRWDVYMAFINIYTLCAYDSPSKDLWSDFLYNTFKISLFRYIRLWRNSLINVSHWTLWRDSISDKELLNSWFS